MPSIGRMIAVLIVAVVVSLAMVLVITSRQVKDDEVVLAYGAMVTQDKASQVKGPSGEQLVEAKPMVRVVQWTSEMLGLGQETAGVRVPPKWLMTFAVTWDRAKVFTWWWLPLVLIGVRILVGGFARKKSHR